MDFSIETINEIPHDKKRVVITMSNGATVTIFKATVKEYGLTEGQYRTVEEVEKIANEGEEHIAFTTAMDSLSRGLKSQNEMQKLLKTKGFSANATKSAISKLLYYNYLGDKQYAETYVSYKGAKVGRRKIIYDMVAVKGIDKSVAEEIAYELLTDEEELEKAVELANKYIEKEKRKRTRLKERTYSFLATRGFDSDIISGAMSKLDFSESDEDFNE